MLFEEISLIDTPSDASFWGGVAVGTAGALAVGWIICC